MARAHHSTSSSASSSAAVMMDLECAGHARRCDGVIVAATCELLSGEEGCRRLSENGWQASTARRKCNNNISVCGRQQRTPVQ
jgi:hypothetical protein